MHEPIYIVGMGPGAEEMMTAEAVPVSGFTGCAF